MTRALADLQRVLASPSLVLLREGPRHAEVMARTIAESGATGNLVQDAHIAALCLENGATELISGDRDFGRFPGLRLHNPFSA
jgi:hypothetical protein